MTQRSKARPAHDLMVWYYSCHPNQTHTQLVWCNYYAGISSWNDQNTPHINLLYMRAGRQRRSHPQTQTLRPQASGLGASPHLFQASSCSLLAPILVPSSRGPKKLGLKSERWQIRGPVCCWVWYYWRAHLLRRHLRSSSNLAFLLLFHRIPDHWDADSTSLSFLSVELRKFGVSDFLLFYI